MDLLNKLLPEKDSLVYEIILREKKRQRDGLELIASENYPSAASLQALSSCLHNKYSDGYPGKRLCGGTENVDEIEILCQKRALAAFKLNSNEWGVNVQAYSGSPANFAVFAGILAPHDRIMGLDFADGGHFTHGYMTSTKRVSATSKFFETFPYKVNEESGLIDYDQLAENATLFKPKLIIAGICCYSRLIDYKRMREIADDNNAFLMGDIAHISGLVAAGVIPSPFDYCDIVTTTTHKSLRGPRSGLIFYRKSVSVRSGNKSQVTFNLEQAINDAVFPGLQSGPHNHAIAGVAVALGEALSSEFVEYQVKVLKNAKTLAHSLAKKGYNLVTGGTDTHLVLVNLKNKGTDGKRVERVLGEINISCNKFTCPGEKSSLNCSDDGKNEDPRGLRFGSPALTSRGFSTNDFEKVCEFIDRGVQLTIEIQNQLKDNSSFVHFEEMLCRDPIVVGKVNLLKNDVVAFAQLFPVPGLDDI